MLNFKNTNIVFIILLLLIAGLATRYHVTAIRLPVYCCACILSLVLFYGSYYVGSNFFMKVLCRANTTAMQIAISFDDGPAHANTPRKYCGCLNQTDVPAVFFCIGKNIAGNEALLKQITRRRTCNW